MSMSILVSLVGVGGSRVIIQQSPQPSFARAWLSFAKIGENLHLLLHVF